MSWDQAAELVWIDKAGSWARPYGRLGTDWTRQVLEGYLQALDNRTSWGWRVDINELKVAAFKKLLELGPPPSQPQGGSA